MEQRKQTILEWYRTNQKFIDAPCGGRGECGRCKVEFLANPPEPTEREQKLLTEEEIAGGVRLACMTEMVEGSRFHPIDEELWMEPDGGNRIAKAGAEKEEGIAEQREGAATEQEEEATKQEKGTAEKEKSVAEQEEAAASEQKDGTAEKEEATETEQKEMATAEQEETTADCAAYGTAVDIGTTTLVMRMVNLDTGKAVATVAMANPQRTYGADVITRIQFANEGKLQALQKVLKECLAELFDKLLTDSRVSERQVKKIVIVGNTAMLHILQGYSCEGLGAAPFAPVDLSLTRKTTPYGADVVILPGISAFVGADIAAGMYYCDMDLKETPHMLIDVGTNGELVLGDKNGFLVTSTAAGPVFEGGNISCGLPSIRGGVTHMKLLKNENYHKKNAGRLIEDRWDYECLGKQTPCGICGSGLVDLAAELCKAEIIDENGTLAETYFDEGYPIRLKYPGGTKTLTLTQSDIRELQMGKAAIRAGIELLSKKAAPERIYLAGAFGTQIDLESAATIGLFSKVSAGKMVPVGNTALEGAQKLLFDSDGEVRICEMVQHAKEVLLANEADFEDMYIGYMQVTIQ